MKPRSSQSGKNGPKRFAIYLRCSSDDQKHGDYTTIDTQREKNTERVVQRGGVLIGEYADEGKSGTKLEGRPGWKQLLADAQAGKIDAVVVTYMSRLARGEAYHVAEYLLKEVGVQIELVQEHFTLDLAGHVNKQMTILMDGMYPKMVSQWTRTKMEQMIANGYVCGQIPPLGYRKVPVTDAPAAIGDKKPPQRLVPDPDTAPLVRRAFEVLVQTRSFPAVCDYLQTVTGKRWRVDQATRLIRNDIFRGVLRFGEWVNQSSHEAIVSEALWGAAQEADQSRARTPKQQPVDEFTYLLRGLVWCQQCGCRMIPVWHSGRASVVRYYECVNALKHKAPCPIKRVNAVTLHEAVLSEIERAAQHPTRMTQLIRDAVKHLPEAPDLAADMEAVSRRLRDIEQRMARIQEAIETGKGTLRPLLDRLEALEGERLPVEAKYRELQEESAAQKKTRVRTEDVCAHWKRLMELWAGATDGEREELMQALVVRVEMREKNKGACEVSLLAQAPESWLELNSNMGAGVGFEPTTFGL